QGDAAAAAVGFVFRYRREPVRDEHVEEAAEIAGIQPQPLAQVSQVLSPGADFEQEPCLSERSPAPEIAAVQRAGAQCHQTIETANLIYLRPIHYLTLVR